MTNPFRTFVFLTIWLALIATGLWLGVWQLQRLDWKNRWQAHIDAAYSKAPQVLTKADLFPVVYDKTTFLRGQIYGHPELNQAMMVGPRTRKGLVGWHIYVPIRLSSGMRIWANLGFVENGVSLSAFHAHGQSITGIFRPAEYSGLARPVHEDGKRNQLIPFTRAFLEAAGPKVSPFTLYAEKGLADWPKIIPVAEHPVLRNAHRNYAIFWFLMAGLAMLYGGLAFRSRRCLSHENGV